MRIASILLMLFAGGCGCLQNGERLKQLRADLSATEYELDLRQQELDEMVSAVRKPGTRDAQGRIALGVSPQWFQRRDALRDKITQLQVKEHRLIGEIQDATTACPF